MIQRTENGQTLATKLTAIYPLHESPWPHPKPINYRLTDFADLGNKENDPFIKSILSGLKDAHNHRD